MRKKYEKWIKSLERFTDRKWYLPLISFLALLDLFVFIVPTDTLLISYCAFHPRKWRRAAFLFTTTSALGALLMAIAIRNSNDYFIQKLFAVGMDPSKWQKTTAFIETYGAWAMGLHAFGPFPLQPGVVVIALGNLSLFWIFISVWLGRGVKYAFFSWAGARAPHLLRKFKIIH